MSGACLCDSFNVNSNSKHISCEMLTRCNVIVHFISNLSVIFCWTCCFIQERTLPYVVGLTGSTASGKSSVCARLERLGAVIIDCDKLGKLTLYHSIILYCVMLVSHSQL